jgi:hypothetical protein
MLSSSSNKLSELVIHALKDLAVAIGGVFIFVVPVAVFVRMRQFRRESTGFYLVQRKNRKKVAGNLRGIQEGMQRWSAVQRIVRDQMVLQLRC